MKLSPKQKAQELLAEDPKMRDQAKDLFMRYVPHNDIAKQLGISSATVATWRKREAWAALREEQERALLEDDFGTRRVAISRITGATTEQIERGLAHLRTRPNPPTVQEIEKLSIILSNLDKIARLDSNKATENIAIQANVKLSADEIRAIIASDPFLAK